MPGDFRYRKLIVTEHKQCPDICHFEIEKIGQAENDSQGLNTKNVNMSGGTAKVQSPVNTSTTDV